MPPAPTALLLRIYVTYIRIVISNQGCQSKILLVELGNNSPTVGLEPTTTRLRALRSAD